MLQGRADGEDSIQSISALMFSVTRGNIYLPWVCFTLMASNVEHICLPRESQLINQPLKKDVNEIISMFPRNLEVLFLFFIKQIPGYKTLLLLLLLRRYKISIQETAYNYVVGFAQGDKIK